MPYSTIADLKNYLPKDVIQYLSDDNNLDDIDPEKVNFCIKEADDRIDGYLRGRYTVPIPGIPPTLIRDFSIRLTAYFLYKRTLSTVLPESIKADYSNTMKELHDVQAGRLSPFEVGDNPAWMVTNKQGQLPISQDMPVSSFSGNGIVTTRVSVSNNYLL